MAREFAKLDSIQADVEQVVRVGLRSRVARLLGGEPLLHRDLLQIVRVVRDSGISEEIHIVTNGTLLDRTSDELWDEIDRIELSLYPGLTIALPEEPEPKLKINYVPEFNETFSMVPHQRREVVDRVWNECRVRNFCHGIVGGYFYKCMRAAYMKRLIDFRREDGHLLKTATAESIAEYLSDEEPLAACWNCTGSCGKYFAHEQVGREAWVKLQSRPIGAMLRQ